MARVDPCERGWRRARCRSRNVLLSGQMQVTVDGQYVLATDGQPLVAGTTVGGGDVLDTAIGHDRSGGVRRLPGGRSACSCAGSGRSGDASRTRRRHGAGGPRQPDPLHRHVERLRSSGAERERIGEALRLAGGLPADVVVGPRSTRRVPTTLATGCTAALRSRCNASAWDFLPVLLLHDPEYHDFRIRHPAWRRGGCACVAARPGRGWVDRAGQRQRP